MNDNTNKPFLLSYKCTLYYNNIPTVEHAVHWLGNRSNHAAAHAKPYTLFNLTNRFITVNFSAFPHSLITQVEEMTMTLCQTSSRHVHVASFLDVFPLSQSVDFHIMLSHSDEVIPCLTLTHSFLQRNLIYMQGKCA